MRVSLLHSNLDSGGFQSVLVFFRHGNEFVLSRSRQYLTAICLPFAVVMFLIIWLDRYIFVGSLDSGVRAGGWVYLERLAVMGMYEECFLPSQYCAAGLAL